MAEKFQCPSCGAPLDIPENVGSTLRCPYCSAAVVVPAELREDRLSDNPRVIKIDLSGRDVEQEKIDLSPDDPIMEQIRAGNKIEAIKLYRQRTGLGLKESKDAVESLQRGVTGLQPATQTSVRGGCVTGGIILATVILLAGALLAAALSMTVKTTSDAVVSVQEDILSNESLSSPTSVMAVLVRTMGEEGEGAGKMTDARSVTQDREGIVYVADYLPGRIQAFSKDGEFLSQWKLEDPKLPLNSIAALGSGRLAVLTNQSVGIYDGQSGELLAEWSDGDKSGYNDAWLMKDGSLAVTRTTAADNDLLAFNQDGQILWKIENAFTSQTDDTEMEMKVAIDLDGNVYLLGSFNRLVLKYDRQGKFITRMGGEGSGPGKFTFPDDIAVDSAGRVYVSEGLTVSVFDPNGSFVDSFQTAGVASGLSTNKDDELLVAARSHVLIYRYAQ